MLTKYHISAILSKIIHLKLKRMKKKIIDFLNRHEYAQTIFPYIELESQSSKYNIPDRVSTSAYLPRIFDPVWKAIWSPTPECFCRTDELGVDFTGSTGKDMNTLAGRYVGEKTERTCSKKISSGVTAFGSLPVYHQLSVHPGSEPAIILIVTFSNISLELWCTKWDMLYRPPEFFGCCFALKAYKNEFSPKGSLEQVESFSIDEHYLNYSGDSFFKKSPSKGSYCVEISDDKFKRTFKKAVMKEWWPFMKKFDDSFLLPFGSILNRDIILMK